MELQETFCLSSLDSRTQGHGALKWSAATFDLRSLGPSKATASFPSRSRAERRQEVRPRRTASWMASRASGTIPNMASGELDPMAERTRFLGQGFAVPVPSACEEVVLISARAGDLSQGLARERWVQCRGRAPHQHPKNLPPPTAGRKEHHPPPSPCRSRCLKRQRLASFCRGSSALESSLGHESCRVLFRFLMLSYIKEHYRICQMGCIKSAKPTIQGGCIGCQSEAVVRMLMRTLRMLTLL